MNRAKWLIFSMLMSTGGAWAQITSVMVGTNANAAVFSVDSHSYNTTQTFLWPAGSIHILNFSYSLDSNGTSLGYQATSDGLTRFTFGGWTASTGALPGAGMTVTVTADPNVT